MRNPTLHSSFPFSLALPMPPIAAPLLPHFSPPPLASSWEYLVLAPTICKPRAAVTRSPRSRRVLWNGMCSQLAASRTLTTQLQTRGLREAEVHELQVAAYRPRRRAVAARIHRVAIPKESWQLVQKESYLIKQVHRGFIDSLVLGGCRCFGFLETAWLFSTSSAHR